MAFAATPMELALRSVLSGSERKMAILSMYMLNLQKVRMDYSSHGIYRGNHVVFSLYSLLSS